MSERILTAKGLLGFLFAAYRAYRGDPEAALEVLKTVKTTAEKARERVEGG